MTQITHAAIIPLAGGFSLGASSTIGRPPEAIFSYKAFYENDKLYLRYLQQHNINVPYYQIDNDYFDLNEIINHYKNKINYVHGVPPCNALSQAAQRTKGSRSTAAPIQWLYKASNFILEHIEPTVFIFENAPMLYTSSGEPVRNNLIDIGKKFGYAITFYKTNTIQHGIPQFRPRTFVIFLKGNRSPILNYYNKKYLPLSEYLDDIPESASLQKKYMNCDSNINEYEITKFFKKIYGESWRNTIYKLYKTHLTSYDYLKRQGLLEQFQSFLNESADSSEIVKRNIEHVIKKTKMGKNFRLGYRVLGLDKNYTYAVISEMMGRTLHPTKDRFINIREYMHLMGLPPDYELESGKEYAKITQNVPTTTCSDITAEALAIINGERELYHDAVLMQNNTNNTKKIKTNALF